MTSRIRRSALPIAALAFVLAACSSGASASPSAAEPTPSPTASPTAAPSPTEEPSPTASPSPTPNEEVFQAWAATATEHRGLDGEQFEYACPVGGTLRFVWGTDVYTDDSSVCTAGVHVGVITLEEGGTVTIEIRPGQDSYVASERNGVITLDYPAWGGSYVVIDD